MTAEEHYRQSSVADDVRRAGEEARRVASSVAEISAELRELAQRELGLARAETSDQVGLGAQAGALGAATAVLVLLVLVFLGLALMFGLAEAMPEWAAALVTALVIAVLATATGLLARSRARQLSIVPKRTLASVGKDMQWAREQMLQSARSRSSAGSSSSV